MHMFRHFAAALVAFTWCIRNQQTFQISFRESKRYWLKAINLAICYQGFASDRGIGVSFKAGKAGFFCCAYDVITDWRNFDPLLYQSFEKLAKQYLSTSEAQLALSLYQVEKQGLLAEDGLTRGTIALEFVTKIIGSESLIRQTTDFNRFGIVLQIVDDVLDIEDDKRERKMNSLFSKKRNQYLKDLIEFPVEQVKAILPDGSILWAVVTFAQQKARNILSQSPASEPLINVNSSPDHNIA
jgi:hypothetical protein